MKDASGQRTIARSEVHVPLEGVIRRSGCHQWQGFHLKLFEIFGDPPQGGGLTTGAERHGSVVERSGQVLSSWSRDSKPPKKTFDTFELKHVSICKPLSLDIFSCSKLKKKKTNSRRLKNAFGAQACQQPAAIGQREGHKWTIR